MISFTLKKKVSILLILSLVLQVTSCSSINNIITEAPQVNSFHDVMPYDGAKLYTMPDLYPYKKSDLEKVLPECEKNILNEINDKNKQAGLIGEEKDKFMNMLGIKSQNYITLKSYIENYDDKNYSKYYLSYTALPKCDYFPFINSYGCFKDNGLSKLEYNVLLNTMVKNNMFYSAECDIFERAKISKTDIDKFNKNDFVNYTSSVSELKNAKVQYTIEVCDDLYTSKNNIKLDLIPISTSSYMFIYNDKVNTLSLYGINDDNETYDFYTSYFTTVNKYIATKKLNILNNSLVGFTTDLGALAIDQIQEKQNYLHYSIDDIYSHYKTGTPSNIHQMYNDSIYANRVSFDSKGFITSLIAIKYTDREIMLLDDRVMRSLYPGNYNPKIVSEDEGRAIIEAVDSNTNVEDEANALDEAYNQNN